MYGISILNIKFIDNPLINNYHIFEDDEPQWKTIAIFHFWHVKKLLKILAIETLIIRKHSVHIVYHFYVLSIISFSKYSISFLKINFRSIQKRVWKLRTKVQNKKYYKNSFCSFMIFALINEKILQNIRKISEIIFNITITYYFLRLKLAALHAFLPIKMKNVR